VPSPGVIGYKEYLVLEGGIIHDEKETPGEDSTGRNAESLRVQVGPGEIGSEIRLEAGGRNNINGGGMVESSEGTEEAGGGKKTSPEGGREFPKEIKGLTRIKHMASEGGGVAEPVADPITNDQFIMTQ